jgi:2',3'-cyclic-nucleotide 2'-phosphodiesterase (5'-nucleotidase family)
VKKSGLFILFTLLLTACGEIGFPSSTSIISSVDDNQPIVNIDLYNLNDFHGMVEFNPSNGELGINRLAGYFDARLRENPNTLFLSSGDMWQGSADSNITRGRLVVDAMNLIGFSGMAIGNHEFDWTDEVIYSNRERANFPLLGINIIDKRTNQRAGFADPYIMVEKSGVKIGIIGTIGAGLESSILASAVEHYDFVFYSNLVREASQTLRSQGAQIVVLLNHDGNVESGAVQHVDAVFNGHTHRREVFHIDGKPVYQGLAYGQSISHIRFNVNKELNTVTFLQAQSGVYTYADLDRMNQMPTELPAMKTLYDNYLTTEINTVKNEVVGTAEGFFTRAQLGRLAVDEMLAYGRSVKQEVVASFHNTGGVRSSLNSGVVTYGDLYRAFPFDNELMIVEVTGNELSWWIAQSLYMKTIPNLLPIQSNQTYWIISINYLTEKYPGSSAYYHNIETAINTFGYVREQLKSRWLAEGTIRAIDFN